MRRLPGRRGRRPGRAGGVPPGRVVPPAQRRAQPGHHPGRGQVGPRPAAPYRGQRGRHAHHADVRGGRHVQVVEVEHVPGHGPACPVRQRPGQPGHPVLAGGQGHRHRVQQRPVRQLQVLAVRLQSGGPFGQRHRHRRHATSSPKICTAISSIIYRVAGRGTYPVAEQDRYVNHFGSVEELMALSLDTECEVVSPLQRKVDVETASRLRLGSDEICHGDAGPVARRRAVLLHLGLPAAADRGAADRVRRARRGGPAQPGDRHRADRRAAQ